MYSACKCTDKITSALLKWDKGDALYTNLEVSCNAVYKRQNIYLEINIFPVNIYLVVNTSYRKEKGMLTLST